MPLLSLAQIDANITTLDFGTIERGSERFIDVTFSNSQLDDARLLRTKFPPEYEILWSDRNVPGEGTTTLRVKVNPRKLGQFKHKVDVWYTSLDKPIVLTLKGDVDYIDPADNPACPDFSQKPAECCPDDVCEFLVLDSQTKKPLGNAGIQVVRNGKVQKVLTTNRDGEASAKLPISWHLFVARHKGHFPNDTANYVNTRNNFFVIELDPREPIPEDAIVEAIEVYEVTETEPELTEEISIRIDFGVPKEEEEEDELAEEVPQVESEILPESVYAENNIVFLVDISHSMAQYGKLELLKASMLELTGALREIDKVAFVTYASDPEVMLTSTSGDQKAAIEKIIEELEAGGMTSGAKGFKKAYELASDNFTKEGNNQIIVCTDGAFREKDNDPIVNMVKKNRRRGITTSVVGIKSNRYASEKLSTISEEGEGSFIPMEEYDMSRAQLVEEIKKQSRKN